MKEPLIINDATVLGILMSILGIIFLTSSSRKPFWVEFYKYVPALLLCYFIPSIFNSLGIISGDSSNLYYVASRYLLPTSLALLTISIDLKEIRKLGFKALILFFTGTLGIIIGGPIAILIVSSINPAIIGGSDIDSVWRGLSTVAGSWIGGGANQAAMKEVFQVDNEIFSAMVAVDVIVANIWMAFLLYGAGINDKIDNWLQADSSSINVLKNKIEAYQAQILKIPNTADTIKVLSIGFGITSVAHFGADLIAPWIFQNAPLLAKFSLTSKFFWLIVISTTLAVFLSFTKARELEGVGASRIGSVFIYILVATIGMKMNVLAIFDNPGLFIVGLIWMMIHAGMLISVAKFINAPFFSWLLVVKQMLEALHQRLL